jgi:hypothetical protein
MSTLLTDARRNLFKDRVLLGGTRPYAALEPKAVAGFQLTGQLEFPVPTYSGQVACIFDALGGHPFLAAVPVTLPCSRTVNIRYGWRGRINPRIKEEPALLLGKIWRKSGLFSRFCPPQLQRFWRS